MPSKRFNAGFRWVDTAVRGLTYGCGSKRKPLETTGFGLVFLLPIGCFGYTCLTYGHIAEVEANCLSCLEVCAVVLPTDRVYFLDDSKGGLSQF